MANGNNILKFGFKYTVIVFELISSGSSFWVVVVDMKGSKKAYL